MNGGALLPGCREVELEENGNPIGLKRQWLKFQPTLVLSFGDQYIIKERYTRSYTEVWAWEPAWKFNIVL